MCSRVRAIAMPTVENYALFSLSFTVEWNRLRPRVRTCMLVSELSHVLELYYDVCSYVHPRAKDKTLRLGSMILGW